jgi:hypothetical protein
MKPLETGGGGGSKGSLAVRASDGSRVAMKIEVKSDSAFRRLDGIDAPVKFSVEPVPDSLQQEGAFKGFLTRGTLKSIMAVEVRAAPAL